MGKTMVFFLLFIVSISVNAQDKILLANGDTLTVKLVEIGSEEIKYKKLSNLTGPVYSIRRTNVYSIYHENGEIEVFDTDIVIMDETLIRRSNFTPYQLLKRGNSVFIEIPDEASRASERYFIDAMEEWGYWKIVDDVSRAHFIIEYKVTKKAMLDKAAQVTFKNRLGQQFDKSKSYRASTTAFTGYNSFYAVAKKIVEKYFKKEFQ